MKVVREVEVGVPPATAWQGLTDPEIVRRWYFGMDRVGEIRPGERLQWKQGENVLEEGSVVSVDWGRRYEVETRFLFTPGLAADPPHRAVFEVEASARGSLVRVIREFAGEGPTSKMVAGDANYLLGLRLAIDPSEQAALARLPEIGEVVIRDLTPDLLPDYQRFFDVDAFRAYPAWQGCYCIETHWNGSAEEALTRTAADNLGDMRELIARRQVTALLAYAGSKPVGWCNYGPTTALAGVVHKLGLDTSDYDGVGSLACFVIAAPYRGHGVAARLLETALDRLRSMDVRTAEAYPVRDAGGDHANYRGPLAMYLRAGFQPYREAGRHTIVRKELV